MFWALIKVLIGGTVENLFDRVTSKDRRDDPVYKKNLQRLIERNRQFEEERNERHS
jgi:hypothetical protein